MDVMARIPHISGYISEMLGVKKMNIDQLDTQITTNSPVCMMMLITCKLISIFAAQLIRLMTPPKR